MTRLLNDARQPLTSEVVPMHLPVAIAFRNLPSIEWVDAEIQKRAAKLISFCPDIQSCRVLVEVPHRHRERGNRLHVRVDLTVPGEKISVSHAPDLHALQRDLGETAPEKRREADAVRKDRRLVIREAFDIAKRQLQDYARRRRRAVKTHDSQPRGRVTRWSPRERGGFIEAADGHSVYFHERSVLAGGLKRLKVGSGVAFVEEQGDKGPQASTVRVLDRSR